MNQIAQTILEQLGNGRFIAMTGAKTFVYGERTLQFRIGRGATGGINCIRIELEGSDTYKVEFFKIRGLNCDLKKEINGLVAEDLQRVFTNETGFETRL